MQTELVPAYNHAEKIQTLFSEYTDMLITNDSPMSNSIYMRLDL